MSQSPDRNSDSQQPDANSSEHQVEAFQVGEDMSVIQGDNNRAIQGDKNRAVQGDKNRAVQGNSNQTIQGENSQINNIWNIFNPQQSVPGTQLTRQEYRNRQALLSKVKTYWVKDVLEKSLYHQVLIELGLEERPDAITNPLSEILEIGDDSPQPVPKGTKVIDVFDQIGTGRTLLILGEPGSGKTTTLLELARDLIARAEQDTNQLIPVVLNLSSWAKERQTITDWLVEELNTIYKVPKKIVKAWVSQQQLLLLLDGLDEVKADYRNNCIAALNTFHQEYGAELVVCSRIKDYQALSNRLNFQKAVYIKLLTLEQVCHYLNRVGTELTGLRTLIAEDTVLQELAQSPLMLNIMTLAYQGVAIDDFPRTDVIEERRKQLFDAYIEKMFKRRKTNKLYNKGQVKYWLIWMAQKMVEESQTVFLIEKMQPTWLHNKCQKCIYSLGVTLNVGLLAGLSASFMFGVIEGPIVGLGVGLITGLERTIKTVETLAWSWNDVLHNFFNTPLMGLSVGIIAGPEIKTKTSPNEGIWRSAFNACKGWLFFSLPFGLLSFGVGLVITILDGLTPETPILLLFILINSLLISGMSIGLYVWLRIGGVTCIKHFFLRFVLYRNNYIPWNYARFLDYAADRIFLQKVGGGYIFIHRMLMEHFAQIELEN
ncbi:NACHT domain-containing protein [Moorena sp. SIO3A2]|uniref:NACHT domain-containing protein n=1 Tax=Moorena sp. SIO3A2 TaxID=2607841 RepID=UPI0013B66A19|nr:NACHT domain-containing protein [Moorena sp. SIO3A2]NER91568.1 NACHT domain-containing protein [Moorena sp. SIO3A2]